MRSTDQIESHHGVFINISGHGVLIIGSAGIGKSSLALELLSQGHQLIADDVVEFSSHVDMVVGFCPPLLKALLHTRELGLIAVLDVFGNDAWHAQHKIDYVVELSQHLEIDTQLTAPHKYYTILGLSFPLVTLSISNPASLSSRLICWLAMQNKQYDAEQEIISRQQSMMS